MRHVILGTAGHIDHGKSSLVKALTGIDPDRLKEEKERGITLDLGFAYLRYEDPTVGGEVTVGGEITVGIVDVPGHERLVRNMLAGAAGIDIVLFVIAADEGIMPQTKEHLAICNLLKIKSGIIALNKADLVEPDWLELVKEEIREFVKGTFLEGAEIIPVSAKTGLNIDLLKERIRELSLKVPPKPSGGAFRLPIDRVFILKGFGTIVTGTVISGSIRVDEPVEILPTMKASRVRGLQSHGRSVTEGFAGQRLAINLQGIEKEEIKRGDIVVKPEVFRPTDVLNIRLELLKDAPVVKNRGLLHLHIWTSEAIARLILFDREELRPGDSALCQLRLDRKIITSSEDRFVIRRVSPLETIGGGVILDPYPVKRRYPELLKDLSILERGTLPEKLSIKILRSPKGMTKKGLYGWINRELSEIEDALELLKRDGTVVEVDGVFYHSTYIQDLREKILRVLKEFHTKNPLKPGILKEELRTNLNLDHKLFDFLIGIAEIIREGEYLRLKDFKTAGIDPGLKERILLEIRKGAFQPPLKEELAKRLEMDVRKLEDILKLLSQEGLLERINDSLYISRENLQELFRKLKIFFSTKKELSVSDFRDMLQTSRRYAIPLLEYLDSRKITMRVGDVRKLLKEPPELLPRH